MPALPDIILFALVPLLISAVAFYFATSRAGDRAVGPLGFETGIATAATLVAIILIFLPGEAYYIGLRGMVPVVLVWLLIPLLAWNILPGIVGPTIGSPLSYLELRFGQRLALVSGIVYLFGRLILSALVLTALARMLALALGGAPAMFIALAIGLFGTLCGTACGKRGATWLNVLLVAMVAIGVPFAIATVIKQTGGPEQLWEISQNAQRTWIGDPSLNLSEPGVTWTLLPFAWTALLVLLLGDEATAVRLARLRSAASVRVAFVTLLAAVSFFTLAWMYTGLGVFAYFHKHPHEVPPKWVTNVEPESRLSRTDPNTQLPILDPATGKPASSLLSDGVKYDKTTGVPILTWEETDVRPETLPDLIRNEKLYIRNSPLPATSAADLLNETGERVDPAKLATIGPLSPGWPNEMLLHRRATEELWPFFVSSQAPPGMRGLLLGGLLAAAIAMVDMTGVVGIPALHRLFPSRTAGAERILAALASLGVTLLAMLFVFLVPFPASTILYVLACSLTPVAALVMLGLTSRRATSGVALATLLVGVAAAVAVALLLNADTRARVHPMWTVTFTFAATAMVGHLLAMVFGESRRRGQLRGLVLGAIPIGALQAPETTPEINVSELPLDEPPLESERWK